MRFNKLDLNLLVALDLLLTERSIGRAAKHLNMSQSAMSGSLARLREYAVEFDLIVTGSSSDICGSCSVSVRPRAVGAASAPDL